MMATAQQSLASLADLSRGVAEWVQSVKQLTQPDHVHWCAGTDAEIEQL